MPLAAHSGQQTQSPAISDNSTSRPDSTAHSPKSDNRLTHFAPNPICWSGTHGHKNDMANTGMHYVSGDMDLAEASVPSDGTTLKIGQRMRLEDSQSEDVASKMEEEEKLRKEEEKRQEDEKEDVPNERKISDKEVENLAEGALGEDEERFEYDYDSNVVWEGEERQPVGGLLRSKNIRPLEITRSNIQSAKSLSDAVRSCLGPFGLDKMILDDQGDVNITKDGATMLKLMEVVHPVAKMLVELSKAQDIVAGDGKEPCLDLKSFIKKKLFRNNLCSCDGWKPPGCC